MKILKIFIIIIFSSFWFSCTAGSQTAPDSKDTVINEADVRITQKVDSALTYCRKKGFNTDFCILVDMKIHSGKYRMFVWDFNKDSIIHKSLCCHGIGGESTGSKPVFSNVSGSNCTSLGKYKIGVRSYSQWGIHVHYKLHGLDSTNNNAFKRIVVLHSHTPVPSMQVYPFHLPLGWSLGCPVICNKVMTKLDEMLGETKKPVLLWIYY